MKRKILLLGVVAFSTSMMAQNCQPIFPAIPPVIISADGSHVGSGDLIWICKDLTVDVTGTNDNIFVEKNCTLTLTGGDHPEVYIKGPGSVVIHSSNNNITHEPNVTITDHGTGNVKQSCDTIKVDYTDAPGTSMGGCDVFAGVAQVTDQQHAIYYPNPVRDVLNVQRLHENGIQLLALYTISGQKILEQNLRSEFNTIDLQNFHSGMYLMKIYSSTGVVTETISVQ